MSRKVMYMKKPLSDDEDHEPEESNHVQRGSQLQYSNDRSNSKHDILKGEVCIGI